MAAIAIFIIGEEILLLKCLAVISRLAMKYSKFNVSYLQQIYIKFLLRFVKTFEQKIDLFFLNLLFGNEKKV